MAQQTYYSSRNSKRSSRTNCCVVNCNNKYGNTSHEVVFYSFPSSKKDNERRQRWIKAINRKMHDGSDWVPTKNTRICSMHFLGGKKIEHPRSPSFNPTVFPTIYRTPNVNSDQRISRFQRSLKRKSCTDHTSSNIDHESADGMCSAEDHQSNEKSEENHLSNMHVAEDHPCQIDMSCQTDEICDNDSLSLHGSTYVFICNTFFKEDICESEVQIYIPQVPNIFEKPISRSDKLCGPDECDPHLNCEHFHGYSNIKDETELKDLTGTCFNVFAHILSLLCTIKIRSCKVGKEDRLLIFLMKLKLGLSYSALRVLFNVHRTTIARIFKETLMHLAVATKRYVFWPSKVSVQNTLPKCFQEKYPNCRVIIDCTECRVETPATIEQRVFFYSNYKGAYTVKFLLGITPGGFICFKSKCYGGRTSDGMITTDSGFLNLLEPGDEVMADKGFPSIRTNVGEHHAILVMPPFMSTDGFTADDVDKTYKIASVRVHVERCIQRIKMFNILSLLPNELAPLIDDILSVCCALVNLQPPLIKED